jgi:hypothetical protein
MAGQVPELLLRLLRSITIGPVSLSTFKASIAPRTTLSMTLPSKAGASYQGADPIMMPKPHRRSAPQSILLPVTRVPV